jgi:single-stranded-DNA-specific exonuclease
LLASQLNLINERRQKASSEIYKSAFAQIENQKDEKILIACGEGWGAGLVGLVAGKLNHEFHKPVIVVGKDSDDRFVGSGRSVEGFDITAMLRFASEHLDKFGGHPQACGFSTNGSERFARALEAMRNFANESIRGDSLVASYKADAQIDFDEISWDLFDGIAQMRPFGSGNPEPVFVSRAVKIIGMSVVGNDGKHLRLRLQSQSGKIIQAIGFCLGERCSCLSLGQEINVIYTISVNEWNGNRELQLKLMDLGGE